MDRTIIVAIVIGCRLRIDGLIYATDRVGIIGTTTIGWIDGWMFNQSSELEGPTHQLFGWGNTLNGK